MIFSYDVLCTVKLFIVCTVYGDLGDDIIGDVRSGSVN